MNIIGHQKSSFIDYPEKICTVYFVAGCNFRCPYCHNSHIVKEAGKFISEEEIFSFLNKRKKFIDAVCISGGEPTLYEELYGFIKKIKMEGFLVKLDTNGTNPKILEKLLKEGLIDYVAMDIKAPFHKYEFVTKAKIDIENIKMSIHIIKNANIDYEFRTTVCKELLTKEDLIEIATYLKGSKRYSIQNFRDGETVLAGKNQLHSYDLETLEEIKKEIEGYFEIFKVRK
ncbi:anaerobic ribonucleoside-triphosphate reductase activating protein [Crassaminicella thermophila]|uniref:Anaerobic ribonucleoside-triphosphate reductase activating protein n=1 Tax=Crassaminicella thermophila TaxID=2599308 RepID=A0A5C0SCV6_CRATE|nr:anaerobic ribonucleoside-triphosphate reductase activating protein [Crassaminicella thermophila]QEK11044.1 anaerobic ribonucleoside-triphosphate reductase activating protein [Crassaminicella thermophila]